MTPPTPPSQLPPPSTPPLERRRILPLILIAIVSNSSYSCIAPILPLEMDKNQIPQHWVSLIFLLFPIGYSLSSLAVSRLFEKVGTGKVIAIGMGLQSLLFFWLGHVFEVSLAITNNDYHWNRDDNHDVDPDGGNNSNYYYRGGERITIAAENLQNGDDDNQQKIPITLTVTMLTLTAFLLGCTTSLIATGYYSSATFLFPSQKESAMSHIEMAVGIGYVVGPIFGSSIYDSRGYTTVYVVVSFCMAMMAFVTWNFLAPCLTKKVKVCCEGGEDDEDDDDDVVVGGLREEVVCDDLEDARVGLLAGYNSLDDGDDNITAESHDGMHHLSVESAPQSQDHIISTSSTTSMEQSRRKPTSFTLLKSAKITIPAMTILYANLAWTFMEPILAKRLDDMHVKESWIGVVFALTNVIYIPTAFLMQYLPKRFDRHLVVFLSIATTPIAVLLVGSNHLPLLILGMISIGFFPTPVWISLLPVMQEDVLKMYQMEDPSWKRSLNDVTAGIYNSFMVLGQVVGYVIGPQLNGSVGFEVTTRVVGLMIFVQSLVFYSCGMGGKFCSLKRGRRRVRM